MDHLRELRTRLFVVALAFIVGSSLAYVYRDQFIHVLLSPLKGQKLVYLNVAGGFNFIFLVSIYAGVAFVAPLLIQQLYQFLKPVLPAKVRKHSVRIFFSSLALLCGGVAFGYIYAIPGALKFLYTFAGDYVQASLTADSYLSFIIAYTLGLGLVFQLPLVLLFIHWIKPLKPKGLFRSERWVILLSFIVAAILTPTPDPLNQTIIALPIIIIYQFGVIAILMSIHGQKKKERKALKAAERARSKQARQTPQPQVAVRPAPPQPAPVSATIIPQPVVLPPSSPSHKNVSMDGIITGRRPRPTSLPVNVPTRTPTRPTQLTTPVRPAQPTLRRGLSIDGVSPLFS